MTKLISSIIGLVLLASCVKDAVTSTSVDYFPLQVGNYWNLSSIGTRSIDTIVSLNGINYYRMVHVQVGPTGITSRDTTFYRKTTDGKVYERGTKSTDEILKFDLGANSDQTWTYAKDPTISINTYPWNATLKSVIDTVQLGNNTIRNCYRYYYDIPQGADEETTIWLAPGIGFVKEFYSGGTIDRKSLTKVRINGIVRQF
jgi:hypothetical protein